jgi:peptidoglycan hydrolase-like protein with peptidoglycan-binding domain
MALTSILFRESKALQACAVSHPAHVTPGASGEHVARIQKALDVLDDAVIDEAELQNRTYGRSTAAAVLAYKEKRGIINRSYQTSADDIVGIMTIIAMDDELNEAQERPPSSPFRRRCTRLL